MLMAIKIRLYPNKGQELKLNYEECSFEHIKSVLNY